MKHSEKEMLFNLYRENPELLQSSGISLHENSVILANQEARVECEESGTKCENKPSVAANMRLRAEIDDLPAPYNDWISIIEKLGYAVNKQGDLCSVNNKDSETEILVPLANFLAKPVNQIRYDNGEKQEMMFEIEGLLSIGKTLPRIRVSSKQFNGMSWVTEEWGLRAAVAPGQNKKDQIRYIIQLLGNDIPDEIIYTHTGWRKTQGQWVYLHAGGAIGAENVSVELEDKLQRYWMPQLVANRQQAMKQSLNLLDLAKPEITYPLWATVFLAPLCEPLRKAGYEPAFVTWLHGMTGARKSTITALFMSHFGQFVEKSPPASFKDTVTSVELIAFHVKDSIVWIDDFHPSSNRVEAQKMDGVAQFIMRAYGDRIGRGRRKADLSSRGDHPPRGLCIATGEDTPTGHSTNARFFPVKISVGDIHLEKLTVAQDPECKKLLGAAMVGYIDWLRSQMDELPIELHKMFLNCRDACRKEGLHGRLTDSVAWLSIGLALGVSYANDIGVLTDEEAKQLKQTGWKVFLTIAIGQNERLKYERPAVRFLQIIKELLMTEMVHVKRLDATPPLFPNETGQQIGWIDNKFLYLYPRVAYNVVSTFLAKEGEQIPLSEQKLWENMEHDKMILVKKTSKQGGREFTERTHNKKVNNKSERLLHVHLSALLQEE